MTVSFVVIALNAEKYIDNLFEDLKKQTYPHDKIEVILIDSLSTDQTKSAMKNLADNNDFSRVVVEDNPQKRLPHGWNIALTECKGDIIVRLDAHAGMEADFIEKIVDNILAGEDIVGGRRITIYERGKRFNRILYHAESSMFGSGVARYRRQSQKQYVDTLAHAAYRREVFESAGKYDQRLSRTEDNDIHYRMRRKGYKFCLCPDIISYHHARNTVRGILKQKYLNGYWIGLTLGIQPRCLSIYHFAPAVFAAFLFFSILLAFAWNILALIGLLLLYFLVGTAAAVREMASARADIITTLSMLILPALFLAMHLAYGSGTIIGLAYMPFWKKKN